MDVDVYSCKNDWLFLSTKGLKTTQSGCSYSVASLYNACTMYCVYI